MQYPIYPIEYEPSLRPTFLHDFSPKISFTRGGGVGCRKKIFLKTFRETVEFQLIISPIKIIKQSQL